jgi:hypothetical protein
MVILRSVGGGASDIQSARDHLGNVIDMDEIIGFPGLSPRISGWLSLGRDAARDDPGAVARVLADLGDGAIGKPNAGAGQQMLDSNHRCFNGGVSV